MIGIRMGVEVRFFGVLRQITGRNSIQIHPSKTNSKQWTVGGLLIELIKKHPDLEEELLTINRKSINPVYRLLLNSKEITFKNPLAQSLQEGDILQFFPPISGGFIWF